MAVARRDIHVDDEVLEDLRFRLGRTRWPEQVEGAGWDYGSNLAYIRELCDWWKDEYDWPAWERRLNQWPSFVATVDGVEISFWHIKGAGEKSFPLLLLHGWPGSRIEFLDLLDKMSDPASAGGDAADSFDLVVPDLPGFGFSGKPRERGWGVARMAEAFDVLMTQELGYESYGVHGGDWGGMIAARMGALFPERACAIHTNYAFVPVPMIDELPPEDMEACRAQEEMDHLEGAYHLIQETKADSVSMAQADSPAGFATWAVEKIRAWTDCAGDLESVWPKDVLCTNLMFYWGPASIASAARIYWESFHNPELHWGAPDPQVVSPVAIARFPGDPFARPRSWVERHFNVVRWTDMPYGGHFPAHEQPDLLRKDMTEFFRDYR